MQVVPLAADERFAMADKTEFVKKYNIDNFILSVGRIEPRKNQLNLIRALKGTGLQLVFIGDYVPDYKKYYEVCRDEADKNTKFLGHINHNDTLLASAYAACSIFVLQGWFETPGLAALEAGFAGARLAVTKDGSTREYFKDYAAYFHPGSPRNIREVVIKVLNNKKSDDCRRYIMKNFLWSNAADEYIKIYKRLLS
jgi:glycosyltransferase involved in cell wall biosynthesis